MSGILRLESLTKGNTLKQGDKTPLKYRLFDADGEKLNIAGKSAQVRLVYPDFLTIGYEKDGLTVTQDDTVTFTIDNVIPSRIYHVEIIVDDKFIFPSRADESKFTVDKSSLGTETNIIEIVGVDAVVRKAVDLINDDPNLIIDEDKLVTDIISNTGIGSIEEYHQQFNDVIKELSEEKDYHSLPEIAGARGGHDTLGQRLDETTAQLAQKVSKGEVGQGDLDKNTFVLDASWFSNKFIEDLSNNEINTTHLEPESVKMNHLAIVKKSSNLFNKEDVLYDTALNNTTGNTYDATGSITSNYIKITPELKHTLRHARSWVRYDHNYDRIDSKDGSTPATNIVISPNTNGEYIRFSWIPGSAATLDNQQLNEGDVLLAYEPYYQIINNRYVEKPDITLSDLPDLPADKLGIMEGSTNLFNDKTVLLDTTLTRTSGNTSNADGFATSDFIPIDSNLEHVIKHARVWVVYDKNENIIFSTDSTNPENNIVVPTHPESAYLRISWYLSNLPIDEQQVNKGNNLLTYAPFDKRTISRKYLPDGTSEEVVFTTLPNKIYALVGQELNVYFDNIIDGKDEDYEFDVVCSIGQHFEDYYRVNPILEGTYPITIKILRNNIVLKNLSSEIIVSGVDVGGGISKDILVIGDSTTAGGTTVEKLGENLVSDQMEVGFIGTRGNAPYLHEGRSGWTANQYVTSTESPFVFNGSFNFSEYISTNSLKTPDYVVINLGINDMFNYASDSTLENSINNALADYQTIIDSIHLFDTNIKIGIALTIPPAYSQDAFARSYNSGQTRLRYKRNNILWVGALINEYNGRESENIYLVPINTNIDTRYNFPLDSSNPEVPVNARNTEVTVRNYAVNAGVHPALSGYWQIADIYWYWLKSMES